MKEDTRRYSIWLGMPFAAATLCLVIYAITKDSITRELVTAHNEQLAKVMTDAFVQGVCRTSGNSIGTCEATIVAGRQEYLIKGGVVLQTNGELPATPALLPPQCTGTGSDDRDVNRWYEEPEPRCTIRFAEAAAVPAN